MNQKKSLFILIIFAIGLLLAACGQSRDPTSSSSGKLNVVATTTIVGDVVRQVGGDAINLTVLLPTGADPHSFDPTPQDVAKVADARLIFANGAGLEEFLKPMLTNAGTQARVVEVSNGIQLEASQDLSEGSPGVGDPHTWFDPNNVIVWVQNIQENLSQLDPANASLYAANAKKYDAQLKDLDAWIQGQVSQIPPESRILVTDHAVLTYFALRYGFKQEGAVVPGYSTLAQPNAQELANLENAIRKYNVKAILVGKTINPSIEERVAQDTGVKLVYIYTGSLSDASSPAPNYLSFMRFDVSAIVAALK
jgi:ABC-type Zn uptake system ZnuABC Zn-binding protein ZnuA